MLACNARIEKGSRRAFHIPTQATAYTIPIGSIERRIGVWTRTRSPSRRFDPTARTDVSPVNGMCGMVAKYVHMAENAKLAASSTNAHWTSPSAAISPPAAKPTAVEPNELMAISELAAPSSSSGAISGSVASRAGAKNSLTAAEAATST